VLFDKEKMVMRCGWTGQFLNFSDRRFGLLEMPTVGEEVAWSLSDGSIGWQVREGSDSRPAKVEYQGLRRNGSVVTLQYEVEGLLLSERFGLETGHGLSVFARTFDLPRTSDVLALDVCGFIAASRVQVTDSKRPIHVASKDGIATAVGVVQSQPTAESPVVGGETDFSLLIRPGDLARPLKVLVWRGPEDRLAEFEKLVDESPLPSPLDSQSDSHPLWGSPLVTKGQLGTPLPGSPLAVDTITIPYDNPYKALFFAGGFDFAPDGTCYLCTAHGDVWKVTGIDDYLD
jgi:hypothetical protein